MARILSYGSLNLDLVYQVPHFVQAGETLSSASRTVHCGGKGLNQSIAAARAGIPGYEIDAAARNVITKAGYGQYFGHGFGHSLGLDIHELPGANLSGKAIMPVGCAVSAEPGIYIPGKFGVRIEDVMILHENGAEVITKAPKQLTIL